MQTEILLIIGSNHYPITIRLQEDSAPNRCPFKFEKMWLRVDGFLDLVASWWSNALIWEGNKAFIFSKKLQFVKEQLKQWNREVFKNIFEEKFVLERELEDLHSKVIEVGMVEEDFKREKVLNN